MDFRQSSLSMTFQQVKSRENIKIDAVNVKLLTNQLRDDPHMNPSTSTKDSSHESSLTDTLSIALINYNTQHNNIS